MGMSVKVNIRAQEEVVTETSKTLVLCLNWTPPEQLNAPKARYRIRLH